MFLGLAGFMVPSRPNVIVDRPPLFIQSAVLPESVGDPFAPEVLLPGRELEAVALAEECEGVVVHDFANRGFTVASATHFEDEVRHGGWLTRAPIACGIDTQAFGAELLDHVGRASGCAFRDGVQRHARPEASVQYFADGVFFHVIHQDAVGLQPRVTDQHIQDHSRAQILVVQVRRVDQDQLVVLGGQVQVFQKYDGFILGILVQPDLADAQNVGPIQELGDHRDHLARQFHIFSFFGIDAQPGVMRDSVVGGAGAFKFSELAKVVAKTVRAASIESGPKRGLAHADAAHSSQRGVIVGGSRNHVNVWIKIVHCLALIF